MKIDDIELSNEAFDEHVLKTLHDILQEMITIGESEKLHGISDIIKGKFELALQGTPGVYVPGAKYPGRYPSFWISEEETAAFALEEILTRRDWLKEKATRDDAFHCNITIAEVAEAASS